MFSLLTRLGSLVDSRPRPQIAAGSIGISLFIMVLTRLGSLNALEQTRHGQRFWRRFLAGGHLPSADTLARVSAQLDLSDIRRESVHIYRRLKRNKVLPAPPHGLIALVLDGHEAAASYRRKCSACLKREIATKSGSSTQYYHRYVAASLVGDGFHYFLDQEPLRRGEDEVAAALRLLHRVHAHYPRAFDVVLADGLYARISFLQAVQALGKDLLAVLKNDRWTLTQEVHALCNEVAPVKHVAGRTTRLCWDLDLPWGDLDGSIRVVRTVETTPVKRQLSKQTEYYESSWMWVTTLSRERATTQTAVDLGHRRWAIENEGFNEAVNMWHFDHVYHHEPTAMQVMLLLAMIAYNLLHVFYARNLKPAVRNWATLQHVGRQITADLYVCTLAPT